MLWFKVFQSWFPFLGLTKELLQFLCGILNIKFRRRMCYSTIYQDYYSHASTINYPLCYHTHCHCHHHTAITNTSHHHQWEHHHHNHCNHNYCHSHHAITATITSTTINYHHCCHQIPPRLQSLPLLPLITAIILFIITNTKSNDTVWHIHYQIITTTIIRIFVISINFLIYFLICNYYHHHNFLIF